MKTFLMRSVAAALLLAGTTAHAISLGFNPSNPVAPAGSSVDVDLVISGLDDFSPNSLSTFDLDVLYDPTILGLTTVAFGSGLDVLGLGGNFQDVDDSIPGVVNLYELSLDDPNDLDTLQLGSFTLATLSFDVLAVGTGSLDIVVNYLGDSVGLDLSLLAGPAVVEPGSVTVVPEPGTITLFLMGGLALSFAVRRAA